MSRKAGIGPEQTAQGWDRVAESWTRYIEDDLVSYTEKALELVPIGEGDRVLDVACGPGALCLRAARRGARVLGVDFSEEQIKTLRARAQDHGFDRLEGRVMDGQALDLENETFDAGFSMFGLMFFPDRAQGFAELHRVLRPGARAAVSAWADLSENEWFILFGDAVAAALPDMGAPRARPFMELADPENLRQEMADAGFEQVEVHTVEGQMTIGGAREGWRKLVEANPVLPAMIERVGQTAAGRIEEAFLDLYQERHGVGPASFTGKAHIAVGLRP